jgi:hypothetical protein
MPQATIGSNARAVAAVQTGDLRFHFVFVHSGTHEPQYLLYGLSGHRNSAFDSGDFPAVLAATHLVDRRCHVPHGDAKEPPADPREEADFVVVFTGQRRWLAPYVVQDGHALQRLVQGRAQLAGREHGIDTRRIGVQAVHGCRAVLAPARRERIRRRQKQNLLHESPANVVGTGMGGPGADARALRGEQQGAARLVHAGQVGEVGVHSTPCGTADEDQTLFVPLHQRFATVTVRSVFDHGSPPRSPGHQAAGDRPESVPHHSLSPIIIHKPSATASHAASTAPAELLDDLPLLRSHGLNG